MIIISFFFFHQSSGDCGNCSEISIFHPTSPTPFSFWIMTLHIWWLSTETSVRPKKAPNAAACTRTVPLSSSWEQKINISHGFFNFEHIMSSWVNLILIVIFTIMFSSDLLIEESSSVCLLRNIVVAVLGVVCEEVTLVWLVVSTQS